MRPQSARFLEALTASVMAAVPVSSLDPVAFALAIGREERPIAEIAYAAHLTPAQSDAVVCELEQAGYLVTAGMLVQMTPSGARWWAARQGRH